MLARLAAHINAGQMAAVGLGAGGEGAIVIDDNCAVSMVLEHRQLHNCHSGLLTCESRLCELGLSMMTARPTRITYQMKGIGRARGDRCGGISLMSKLSFLLSAL
jgi:hypothetical protein